MCAGVLLCGVWCVCYVIVLKQPHLLVVIGVEPRVRPLSEHNGEPVVRRVDVGGQRAQTVCLYQRNFILQIPFPHTDRFHHLFSPEGRGVVASKGVGIYKLAIKMHLWKSSPKELHSNDLNSK